ncbi:MAG: DinB family protein [Chloroflexota bacterium]
MPNSNQPDTTEARQYAQYIDRLVGYILKEIEPLSDEVLNQALPISDTNTLFAICTHVVGMGEFWVLSLVGDQQVDRNRAEEFLATGQGDALNIRFKQWVQDCYQLLETLSAADLNEYATPPAEYSLTGGFSDTPMTKRECLLHVVEHTATHLGHIQISCQLLAQS